MPLSSFHRNERRAFRVLIAKMGIKQSNLATPLAFPNVIRSNESNPDSATSLFAGVWMLKKMYPRVTDHYENFQNLKMCTENTVQ